MTNVTITNKSPDRASVEQVRKDIPGLGQYFLTKDNGSFTGIDEGHFKNAHDLMRAILNGTNVVKYEIEGHKREAQFGSRINPSSDSILSYGSVTPKGIKTLEFQVSLMKFFDMEAVLKCAYINGVFTGSVFTVVDQEYEPLLDTNLVIDSIIFEVK